MRFAIHIASLAICEGDGVFRLASEIPCVSGGLTDGGVRRSKGGGVTERVGGGEIAGFRDGGGGATKNADTWGAAEAVEEWLGMGSSSVVALIMGGIGAKSARWVWAVSSCGGRKEDVG